MSKIMGCLLNAKGIVVVRFRQYISDVLLLLL